ncbi:peptide deformylase [Francisellaceae bacterium]|nr:peptide deformylase [Francisellaceae bacterium]
MINCEHVYTGDILRQKTTDVMNVFSDEVKSTISLLIEKGNLGLNGQKAIGVAAPQIGISNRIFIYRLPIIQDGEEADYNVPWSTVINPSYQPADNTTVQLMKEGCLSVPYFYSENVPRYESIEYSYIDENGVFYQGVASGMFAHVFQHETDHLDGKLYIDLLENIGDLKISDGTPIR